MGEPALPLTPTARYGRRHPAVRFRKLAEAPPDLSNVCLVEHFRSHLHLRNGRLRHFLAALCLLATKHGCAHQFQRTYAKKNRVTDRTIRAWLRTLRELDLVAVELTGPHEAHVYPNWEALGLREVTEESSGQPSGQPSGQSFKRNEGTEKQQSARPPASPPAPARAAEPPAAAAPSAAPASPEPANPEARQEASKSSGVGEPVPHPIAPSPAPSRAVLDAGTAPSEPVAVVVDLDDSRIAELDGPRRQLAKCRPLAVEAPPALLAAVLREHGPDAGVDVAEVLRSADARAHPRAALEALEALARKPASQITSSAGGYCRGLLRVAIRGELRRPTSRGTGWSAIGRLHDAREDAEQRQAWDEAAGLRELVVQAGEHTRAVVDRIERDAPPHQLAERMIASVREPAPRALPRSAPRALPAPPAPSLAADADGIRARLALRWGLTPTQRAALELELRELEAKLAEPKPGSS